MTRGILVSLMLHSLTFLLVVFGLPNLFQREILEEPQAISVEVLDVADITNVPNRMPTSQKPVEKAPPKPPETKPAVKPQPPVKKDAPPPIPEPEPEPVVSPTPPQAKPKPKPKPKPKEKEPEPKKEEPKPAEKKPEKPEDELDLDAILKSVKDTAQKQEPAPASEASDATSKSDSAYIDSLPLTMSERDAIRNQIAKCWSPPIGAKDAHNLAAELRVTYEQDGSLINVYLSKTQQARYHSDSFFRSAVDSAMRAVRTCQPLENMPPDKYQRWKDVELTFDPRDLLY